MSVKLLFVQTYTQLSDNRDERFVQNPKTPSPLIGHLHPGRAVEVEDAAALTTSYQPSGGAAVRIGKSHRLSISL